MQSQTLTKKVTESTGTEKLPKSTTMYLREISQFPILDGDEEKLLGWQTKHDKKTEAQEAKRRLVESNLRLVVRIAMKYLGRGFSLIDLIQEGTLGLMWAINKSDYRKGYKFSTYATWWIRQSISRVITDKGHTIRIPVHMSGAINRLFHATQSLTQEYGRDPIEQELATEMETSPEKVGLITKTAQYPTSIETKVHDESDGDTIGEFIEDKTVLQPSDIATSELLKEHIDNILAMLSAKERSVIDLRFGLSDSRSRTLQDVAEEFWVTRERIRQIEKRIPIKCDIPASAKKLWEYLD